MIVKKIWKIKKIHYQKNAKDYDFLKSIWAEHTHNCHGYFLFGFIPLYIVKEKIN